MSSSIDPQRNHPLPSQTPSAAPAALVNRTRRVVRARASALQSPRRNLQILAIPLAVCAAFLLMSSHAVWSLLDQYELSPTGIPDASDQMLVFLLWFLPITAVLLAAAWFRRTRARSQAEFRP